MRFNHDGIPFEGPFELIKENGSVHYYLDGKRHKEDGPAVIYLNGTREWFIRGKHHRIDGPAVILANGFKIYYLNGKALTKERWEEQREEWIKEEIKGQVI